MKVITVIEGCEVSLQDDGSVTWTARGRIDGDGSGGNTYHDPYFQGETSLKLNGKSLNAEGDFFIVVPPQVVKGVRSVVLGCQAWVMHKGHEIAAVVGDIGPKTRLGEMSIAAANALGIVSNPLTGGDDNPEIFYRIQPGLPAKAGGKTYNLQPI